MQIVNALAMSFIHFLLLLFFLLFLWFIFYFLFAVQNVIVVAQKCDCCSPSPLVFFNNKSDANTQNNIPSEKGPLYLSKNKRIPSEIIKLKNDNQTEIDEEEREIKIEKKKIYIQKHSSPCDIELVDGDYYLINNEEVKIIL